MTGRWGGGARSLVALSLWACCVIGSAHAASDGPAILSVDVRGAVKIEASTIISRSTLAVGGSADAAAIRDAIKAVYRMGYFDDVSIEQEPGPDGVHLVIVVSERPTLTDIRYEGYDEIGEDKLKEQVTLTLQSAVDLRAVNTAAAKIQQYYRSEGYAEARVIPVTKTESPGSVSVTFYIEEGTRAKIRAVTFDGNKQIPSKRLNDVVATKKYYFFTSWITSHGIFKHDDLEQDAERLRDFYLNEGYVQVQVGTPRVSPEPEGRGVRVTFPIDEGERYTVARITMTGHAVLSASELRMGLSLREGDIFRRNLLRQDMSLLTDRYGERGYAFVDIRPQFVPRPESRSIDLTYEIREGRPVTVRAVTIEGNEKTYDRVIRRELRVAEQELVNTKALKRSFQRVNNLNFFENVEILPNPIGDDQMDITVRVKEKPTGTFSVGGGYSSVDRFVYQMNIEQGNLFGRGQLLRARMEKSTARTSNYSITFREPYLLDQPVAGTVDLYSNERRLTTYNEIRTGFSLGVNKWFGEYLSAGLSYTREINRLFGLTTYNATPPMCPVGSTCPPDLFVDPNPSDNFTPNAPTSIVEEAARGKVTTSSVGLSLARDTRDFAFDPREGQRHALSIEFAGGPFKGDNRFYRIVTDHSAFFPAFWSTVFSLHLRFGYLAGEQYPFSERFVVGGINTVRGFDYGTAGRVDPRTGEIFGGNKELIFNAEYVFPLIPDAKMKGVVFFDAGRSFDDQGRYDPDGNVLIGPGNVPMTSGETLRIKDLRYSVGFGIRMLLPIGPIRLEWGYNLDSLPGEKTGAFPEFTIGSVY